MGYVRSRKFCCCLPVRFGVFCSALVGQAVGGTFCALGWYEVDQFATNKVSFEKSEKISLVMFSISYTMMAVFSIIGLIGSLSANYSMVRRYGVSITVSTIMSIGTGIYWIYRMYFHDKNACTTTSTDDVTDAASWVCQKGFDVIRIVAVVVLVILWFFQIGGVAIVWSYVSQLKEEQELTLEGDFNNGRPTITPYNEPTATAAPMSQAPMRTTYDSASYDRSYSTSDNAYGTQQGGATTAYESQWADASQTQEPIMKSAYDAPQSAWARAPGEKPDYPFSSPAHAYGRGGEQNV